MHPGTIPRDVLQWSTREPKDSPATRIIGVKSVAALKPLTADNAPCYLDSSDTEALTAVNGFSEAPPTSVI